LEGLAPPSPFRPLLLEKSRSTLSDVDCIGKISRDTIVIYAGELKSNSHYISALLAASGQNFDDLFIINF